MIGWFLNGVLRGAVEIASPPRSSQDSGPDPAAEAAFSVEPLHRRHGVGTALMRRAMRAARNRGQRRLIVMTDPGNAPMLRLGRKFGGHFHIRDHEAESAIELDPMTPMSRWDEAAEERAGWFNAALGAWRNLVPPGEVVRGP